jgi:putative membrane protein
MKRNVLLSLMLAGASFCVQVPVFAQNPGGSPSQTGAPPQPGSAPAGEPGRTGNPGNPDMSGPGGMQAEAQTKVNDAKFAADAAMGGMTEVELGKLATQKGSSEAVKQFGQRMVDDRSKANDELKQVASKGNLTIPDSLDSKHQKRVDKLSKLSGPDFDKAYIKDQLKDHKKDVREFQAEAQSGSNPDVKAFAAKTLPVLEQHLDLVKKLDKSKGSMGTKMGMSENK